MIANGHGARTYLAPARRSTPMLLAGVFAVVVGLAGCSAAATSVGSFPGAGSTNATNATNAADGATATNATTKQPGELTVLAASSLTGVFTNMGERFEAEHPGVTVRFSFAGSADLAAQVQQGAPGDVLATADVSRMALVADDNLLAGPSRVFARNSMMIAVPPDNPAGIATFADLTRPGVAVVACAPHVPCGAATQRVEAKSGITLAPASEERSVTDVLGKVVAGEADAGVVYVTDVLGSQGQVLGVDIDPDENTTTSYPIAVLAGGARPDLAVAFVDLVLGAQGQKVLADAGFAVA